MTTTGIITVQDFVSQNIIYCVSNLIHELTQKEGCIDEETAIKLWQGPERIKARKNHELR